MPYLVNGEDAPVRIHDSAEPNLAVEHRLARDGDGQFFLTGVPEWAFIGVPPAHLWVHHWLEPFPAHLAIDTLVRAVGGVGMFWLLLALGRVPRPIAFGVGVCYAALPYYTVFGLAVAGVPWLILSAMWLIQGASRGRIIAALAILAVFPWTTLVAVLPIYLATGALAWILACVVKRRGVGWLLLGLGVFAAGAIVAHLDFVYATVTSDLRWHREEFVLRPFGRRDLVDAARILGAGHYHAAMPGPITLSWVAVGGLLICAAVNWRRLAGWRWLALGTAALALPGILLALRWERFLVLGAMLALGLAILLFRVRRRPISQPGRLVRALAVVAVALAALVAIPGVYVLWRADVLSVVPGLEQFNISRFYFFTPVAAYLAMGVSLAAWPHRYVLVRLLIAALLALECWRGLTAEHWDFDRLSYRQYVSAPVFDRAVAATGRSPGDLRIACLGFYPSVAHLNGLDTVGGYWNLYPLQTKHAMRRVIAGELEKDPEIRRYFDEWGNRCYVWVAGLRPFDVREHDPPPPRLQDLALDMPALAEMGASHLFAAVPIDRPEHLGLRLIGHVPVDAHPNATLSLWVYELPRPAQPARPPGQPPARRPRR